MFEFKITIGKSSLTLHVYGPRKLMGKTYILTWNGMLSKSLLSYGIKEVVTFE